MSGRRMIIHTTVVCVTILEYMGTNTGLLWEGFFSLYNTELGIEAALQ